MRDEKDKCRTYGAQRYEIMLRYKDVAPTALNGCGLIVALQRCRT